MYTVTFTTGKRSYLFLLVAAAEVEPAHICTGVCLLAREHDPVVAVGNALVNGLIRIQIVVFLIYIGELHGLTNVEMTCQRFQLAGNEFE
ncbi:hypothetical protein D3C86_1967100 [compost metagenome]